MQNQNNFTNNNNNNIENIKAKDLKNNHNIN